MINANVQHWAVEALKPMCYAYAIADCCGAHHGLLLDPVGICFYISKELVSDSPEAVTSVGFKVWNESVQTEQGTWINMRGVSSIPGEEDTREKMSPGAWYNKYTDRLSLVDDNIASMYLNGVAIYLGNTLIPSPIYGRPSEPVSVEDRLETIFATWKGKYIITIQKDQDMYIHQKFLDEIKEKEFYRSPKFQNRGYNLNTDYLQCVIYKF
jgi:hypothetical protein